MPGQEGLMSNRKKKGKKNEKKFDIGDRKKTLSV